MLATRSAPAAGGDRTRAVAEIRGLQRSYERWARRCYRIRDKQGRIRPLELNSGQRRLGEVEREELETKGQCRGFVLKARQGGFSTDQQARALHQVWSQPNFDALTLAHTKEDTEKLFGITQRAIEHFPSELLPTMGDKATSQISFPGLDTQFYTGTAGSKRTGRGMTLKRFHGSEFAFWDDPLNTLATVGGGLVPGSTVWLETTASGFGSPAHEFWLECAARGYRALFFPWWECDRVTYRLPLLAPDELGQLEPEEQDLVERRGLDLEQLKWRRAKIAEYGRQFFLTEWAEDAESCWAAVGGMFYNAETLKALQLRAPTPIETHLGGALRIYSKLEPGERAIMGGDTAEGTGGDRSTAVFRAFPTWRLLADYEDDRVEPKEYAGIVNTWGRHFGEAFLVIEKNAHGITVLRHLRDDHEYPVASIYHRATLDDDQNEKLGRIGWATTAESKPIMLDAGRELLNAARDKLAGVPSLAAIRDAFGVRRGKDGKYDLNGKDMLVAEMLAWIGRTAPSDTGMLDFYAQQAAALAVAKETTNGRT
jgi:hypothetical protein